jgi:hypothetical protein
MSVRLIKRISLGVLVIGFAVIGFAMLRESKATTPHISLETETGAVTPPAIGVDDTTASGAKAVKFMTAGTTTGWKTLSTKPGGWAWQWQIDGNAINENVLDASTNPNKMYDIDPATSNAATISRLKAKGIYVVCYVETGDYDKVRADAGDFAPSILGKALQGFPNEKYINITQLDGAAGPTGKTLRQIMTARFQAAKNEGCEGIEPDLDDLWTYTSAELGFAISRAQQVTYNSFLIQTGHAMGMSVGLKNGADPDGSFDSDMFVAGADFVLNEECNQFAECGGYTAFITGGRPVFQVEYLDNQKKAYAGVNGTCALDNAAGFDGIVKDSSSKLAALPRTPCRNGN